MRYITLFMFCLLKDLSVLGPYLNYTTITDHGVRCSEDLEQKRIVWWLFRTSERHRKSIGKLGHGPSK